MSKNMNQAARLELQAVAKRVKDAEDFGDTSRHALDEQLKHYKRINSLISYDKKWDIANAIGLKAINLSDPFVPARVVLEINKGWLHCGHLLDKIRVETKNDTSYHDRLRAANLEDVIYTIVPIN